MTPEKSPVKRSLTETVWLIRQHLYAEDAPSANTPADPEWVSEGSSFAENEWWAE